MELHNYRLTKEGIKYKKYTVERETENMLYCGGVVDFRRDQVNTCFNINVLLDKRDDELARQMFKRKYALECDKNVQALKKEIENQYDKYLDRVEKIVEPIIEME